MRFFTRGWWSGEREEPWDDAAEAYQLWLQAHAHELPSSVLLFARSINLHDGLIERVQWAPQQSALQWELVVGDLQQGYELVVVRYEDVDTGQLHIETLLELSRDPKTEVLYDEVDVVAPGRFAHRLLFWPDGELDILFRSLTFWRFLRDDRSRHQVTSRFQEVERLEEPPR